MHLTDIISFQKLFSLLPVPAVVLLPDAPRFTIVEANKAYLDMSTATREAVLGIGFFDAFPNNPYRNEQALYESLLEVINTRRQTRSSTREYPFGHVLPNREKVFLEADNIPVLSEQGEVEYILRTLRDMTDIVETRKNEVKAAESLVRSEKLLRETQRFAKIGSWEVDLTNNTLLWSDELRKVYEVADTYQPTMEHSLRFFREGESRDTITSVVTRAIETGEFFDLELPVITAKGNERWLRITGKAEILGGRCCRIYGATQDVTERKRIQESMMASRNKLNSLVQTVDGIVWEAEADTYRCTFISDQVEQVLGYKPETWLRNSHFWKQHIFEEDRARTARYCKEQVRLGNNFEADYRMIKADGGLVWIKDRVTIIFEDGHPRWIRGLMINVTGAKRTMDLEHMEKAVLELNSKKEVSLEKVLTTYLKGIETLFPQMKCSILKIRNGKMTHWASVSLPKEFVNTIQNIPIGPNIGSCGTAAFTQERCIVNDIATDPRWASIRSLVLSHGLYACWSEPILDAEGNVMATFGIYYEEIKTPNEEELRVIDRASSLLKIILENRTQSEVLEETSSLMAQGQDLAHFGTWQWDIHYNLVSWSEPLYGIYGLEKQSFKASFEGYLELIHPDDRGRVYRLILNVLKTKEDAEFEERVIRPSGEVRYLKSWARLKTDERGEPVKMVGACMDITESRKIQEDLLASETRLHTLVESQTNYVIRLDTHGKYLYANKKYINDFGWLFGYKEPLGQSALITVASYHHELVTNIVGQCILHPNKIFQTDLDKKRPDGGTQSTFWHFICLTDSMGNPSEVQCIGIDVSERKKAEAALKITTERYQYVNKATHDAIYDWDIEKDHIEWGEGFKRLFGHVPRLDKYSFQEWAALVHPDDLEDIEESLHDTLENSELKTWSGEYRFRRSDDEYAYVEANGYLLRDGNGKAVRMIGALRNITERKLSEKKLRELHAELQESLKVLAASNADLEQFAYVASHDLQEPLRMVTGFLTQLERKYGDSLDDKAKKYIFFAVDGARRMRQIILDLLDYSRVGRSDKIKEQVNLNELLTEILLLFRKRIEEKRAQVIFPILPKVRTFRSPIRQVFSNLLDNALKYQDDAAAPKVEIAVQEFPTFWEFSVTDNGIGIDKEYFDKIFVIFQRLHSREEYSGTGMGLAITKKIVESLGGQIRVESEEGKGSAFYFTILKE